MPQRNIKTYLRPMLISDFHLQSHNAIKQRRKSMLLVSSNRTKKAESYSGQLHLRTLTRYSSQNAIQGHLDTPSRTTTAFPHLNVKAGPRIRYGHPRRGQAERGRAGGVRNKTSADAERPAVRAHDGQRAGKRELRHRPRHLSRRRLGPLRRHRRCGGRYRCGRCHQPDSPPRCRDDERRRPLGRLLGEDGAAGGERGREEENTRRRHGGIGILGG